MSKIHPRKLTLFLPQTFHEKQPRVITISDAAGISAPTMGALAPSPSSLHQEIVSLLKIRGDAHGLRPGGEWWVVCGGLTGSKWHSSSLQVVPCDIWCVRGVNEGSDKAAGRGRAGIH